MLDGVRYNVGMFDSVRDAVSALSNARAAYARLGSAKKFSTWLRSSLVKNGGQGPNEIVLLSTHAEVIIRPTKREHRHRVYKALIDLSDVKIVSKYRWFRLNKGYARTHHMGGMMMHRLIVGLSKDDPRVPDHISCDKLDNRRKNLRIISVAMNAQNRRGGNKNGCGYRGVHKTAYGYAAHCKVGNSRYRKSGFRTPEEAAVAAAAMRREHMPYSNEPELVYFQVSQQLVAIGSDFLGELLQRLATIRKRRKGRYDA